MHSKLAIQKSTPCTRCTVYSSTLYESQLNTVVTNRLRQLKTTTPHPKTQNPKPTCQSLKSQPADPTFLTEQANTKQASKQSTITNLGKRTPRGIPRLRLRLLYEALLLAGISPLGTTISETSDHQRRIHLTTPYIVGLVLRRHSVLRIEKVGYRSLRRTK